MVCSRAFRNINSDALNSYGEAKSCQTNKYFTVGNRGESVSCPEDNRKKKNLSCVQKDIYKKKGCQAALNPFNTLQWKLQLYECDLSADTFQL